MLRPNDRDYLKNRILTEEVMAIRATSREAKAVHDELARMYRLKLIGR